MGVDRVERKIGCGRGIEYFGAGDPVVVKNSVGTYSKNDGSNDWQL